MQQNQAEARAHSHSGSVESCLDLQNPGHVGSKCLSQPDPEAGQEAGAWGARKCWQGRKGLANACHFRNGDIQKVRCSKLRPMLIFLSIFLDTSRAELGWS